MATLKERFQLVYDSTDAAGRRNAHNCSGFLRGAVKEAGFSVEGATADQQIEYMEKHWTKLGVGTHVKAADAAQAGFLVVAGVKSSEYQPKRTNGHVVVLIPTDPKQRYHGKYAKAWGGDIGKKYMSNGSLSVGEIFAVQVRDRIRYYTPPVHGPQVAYE
jgi:hypothetical protein